MTTHESNAFRAHLDDRIELTGEVDFTMMYAAHDAFSSNLERLRNACRGGNAWPAAEHTRWVTFKAQLHIHHRAEDEALWPPLRATDLQAQEVSTLDAMELEHAQIDPHLEDVDRAIVADDPPALAMSLERLSAGLAAHMPTRRTPRCR